MTAQTVFDRLGIRPKFVYLEQRVALEKLKGGELDAVISVQGKPSAMISQINDDRLHLVPVDYASSLQADYLPASLTAKRLSQPDCGSGAGRYDRRPVGAYGL